MTKMTWTLIISSSLAFAAISCEAIQLNHGQVLPAEEASPEYLLAPHGQRFRSDDVWIRIHSPEDSGAVQITVTVLRDDNSEPLLEKHEFKITRRPDGNIAVADIAEAIKTLDAISTEQQDEVVSVLLRGASCTIVVKQFGSYPDNKTRSFRRSIGALFSQKR